MTFYRVNNYFVLRLKAVAARIAEGGLFHKDIDETSSLWNQGKSHATRVFNFPQDVVEVKTGQSNISPNKGDHVHLVDLKNVICTCQKPQLYRYYYSHMLVACHKLAIDPNK